jgi:hypothetical protein
MFVLTQKAVRIDADGLCVLIGGHARGWNSDLIAVMIRLEGSVYRNAQIVGLFLGQWG